jgi:hypothetical protein
MASVRREVDVLRVGLGILLVSAIAGGLIALARAQPPSP